MTGIPFALEYASANERLKNYCLADYMPVAPSAGKLKSSNLLFQTLAASPDNERLFRLVKLIRSAFGESTTVWGAKWDGNELRWEFYFYDYRRRQRRRSISLSGL